MILFKILTALVCIIAVAVVYAFFCVRLVIWVEELCRYVAFEQEEKQEEKHEND